MGLIIFASQDAPSSSHRRRTRTRIKRSDFPVQIHSLAILISCIALFDIILASPSSTSYCHRFDPSQSHGHSSSLLPLYPRIRSTSESAFLFSLLRNRRRRKRDDATIASESDSVVRKNTGIVLEPANANGDSHDYNLITNNNGIRNKAVNGGHESNGAYYLGDTTAKNGHAQPVFELQPELEYEKPRLDFEIVEDETYPDSVHPVQNAYNRLSNRIASIKEAKQELRQKSSSLSSSLSSLEVANSLDSMEGGNDNVTYVRASSPSPKEEVSTLEQPMQIKEKEIDIIDDDNESDGQLWAKRNARSIDEGIRFKSQLREGLEEQSKLHREQLLSNLLEGVFSKEMENSAEKIKNVTNRFRWRGFGKGDNKEQDSEQESDGEKKGKESPPSDDEPSVSDGVTAKTLSETVYGEANSDKVNNFNKFGARTIAGLISALAEEAEGLEVEVDADADTPLRSKTVNSIKVYFSRLGFRQLRMGGLVEDVFSELDSPSLKPSEKFNLAKRFFNVGSRPTTADEAFDTIDVDKSGTLDEEELAQALKMAAIMGGGGGGGASGGNNKLFGTRSRETLRELASRLVRLYDADGNGVVDREEYQAMVQDMSALRDARLREEMLREQQMKRTEEGDMDPKKRRGWFSSVFGGDNGGLGDGSLLSDGNRTLSTSIDGQNVLDVTDNEDFWGGLDNGEGSIVLEDLKLDLRRLVFGAIPGVKRVLPGGPLILKPFTATITASFNQEDIMDSILLDAGLRRLVARALSRRVRGIRDLLDGAVFYGRTWKLFEQNSPKVEVAKLEDVHFDKRNRLIITGRAKITEALGVRHGAIEQGFKLRTKIGTRANGRIIGLLQPEIAIFAECPKDLEKNVRTTVKDWFGYTIPTFKPAYVYIPLVSPLKKNDKMDGFNMGEDNQIKSIDIKNGKLRIEICAFLRPGRFLGNHYLAFTVPNRTLILTLDRVREGMRNARRNKRLAELAAKEVQQLAAAREGDANADSDIDSDNRKPSISPEGKIRIKRLEKELKATIQEDAILREMEESSNKENGKSFISRFVEGYSGAIREELDLEMNARLSSSISDFFGSQDREGNDVQ